MPAATDDVKKKARAAAKQLRAKAKALEDAAGGKAGYEAHKATVAARQAAQTAEGRDIGAIPAVADPARRSAAAGSFLAFCRSYFPARFPWEFSATHRTVIERIERCILAGGRFTLAMPRGSGKTTIAECALLWAVLNGYRRFVLLVSANDPFSKNSLAKIQKELETNDRLADDFPEVCYPIRRLERIHNRSRGQTCGGAPTRIEWTADSVALPTVAGSKASGAIIRVAGIEGAIRGLSVVGPAGEILRPDLVFIDDAQTRATAKSPTQTNDREAVIADDIMGLAGPGVQIAAVQLCTVIYPGDLSDRYLSHEKHPEWQGLRSKMLEAFPSDMDWWDQYSEVRRESLRSGDEGKRANELYERERVRADAGARVSWEARVKAGEVSAIQSAMNLYYDSPRGFAAEYQNEPEAAAALPGAKELDPADIADSRRLSGLPRFAIRREASHVTAFIDCGGGVGRGLWYAVCDWDATFGGSIIDYGAFPKQARGNFAADDMRPGLAELYPDLSQEQRLYRGLDELTRSILDRSYQREGGRGEELRIERCLIDVGWLSQTVYQFVRSSPFAASICPSKGIGRSTTARGVSEWKPRPGERSGHHWRLTASETGRGRMVQFDPDAWKSFLYERFTTPIGGGAAMLLFGGTTAQPGTARVDHDMIADHCAAESSAPVTLRGATFDKWQVKPHRPDNHLWDCLVGCAIAASVQGLTFTATGRPEPKKERKKIDIEALYANAKG